MKETEEEERRMDRTISLSEMLLVCFVLPACIVLIIFLVWLLLQIGK